MNLHKEIINEENAESCKYFGLMLLVNLHERTFSKGILHQVKISV